MNSLLGTNPDRTLFYDGDGPISVGEFLACVRHVAAALPMNGVLINDCADRFHFSVVLFASVLRKTVNLMPGNRTSEIFQRLRLRYPNSVVCSDREDVPAAESILRISALLPHLQDLSPMTGLPAVDPEQVIAVGFTSGSTGEPKPHARQWRWAVTEARVAGQALGLGRSRSNVVGTTPPQHMYGFVTTIFMPMLYGLPVYRGQPFFPEEIREVLTMESAPSLLVTTPAQIRACVLGGAKLDHLQAILSSAAPLSNEIAGEAEELFNTKVFEFYGSTETGAIASRRTNEHTEWTTFDSVTVRTADDGMLRVNAPYLPCEIALSDIVRVHADDCFQLLGRNTDLIKVGGKRASLSELNHYLLAINGVRDGSFVMTDQVNGREARLAAVVEAPGLDAAQVVEQLKLKLDPVFLPRPLRFVDRMPRTSSGKLPRQALMDLLQGGGGNA